MAASVKTNCHLFCWHLMSNKYHEPMVILPWNGKMMYYGTKDIGVWNNYMQQTHHFRPQTRATWHSLTNQNAELVTSDQSNCWIVISSSILLRTSAIIDFGYLQAQLLAARWICKCSYWIGYRPWNIIFVSGNIKTWILMTSWRS